MTSFEYPFLDHSLEIQYTPKGVCKISYQDKKIRKRQLKNRREKEIAQCLEKFLEGTAENLEVAIDWEKLEGTEFQKRVWKKMAEIPHGETKTYGEIAKSLRKPGAARAVGTACGKNPVLLAIPCHRVVGTNGLGGFSGGGLPMKKKLLSLESVYY